MAETAPSVLTTPPAKSPLKSLTLQGQVAQSIFAVWMFIKLLLLQLQTGDFESVLGFVDANADMAIIAAGLLVTAIVTAYGRIRAVLPLSWQGTASGGLEAAVREASRTLTILLVLASVLLYGCVGPSQAQYDSPTVAVSQQVSERAATYLTMSETVARARSAGLIDDRAWAAVRVANHIVIDRIDLARDHVNAGRLTEARQALDGLNAATAVVEAVTRSLLPGLSLPDTTVTNPDPIGVFRRAVTQLLD